MTLNETLNGQIIQTKRLILAGAALLTATAASLIAAFHRHAVVRLGVLVLCTVLAPALYVAARHIMARARQRETEDRLLLGTLTYLRERASEFRVVTMPVRTADGAPANGPHRRLSGGLERIPPMEAFRHFQEVPCRPRPAKPAKAGPLRRVPKPCLPGLPSLAIDSHAG